MNLETSFEFAPCPDAARWVRAQVAEFLHQCPPASALKERLLAATGTRFEDWVIRIGLPLGQEATLLGLGFSSVGVEGHPTRLFHHGRGMFPVVELGTPGIHLSLRVDSVADFCRQNEGVSGLEDFGSLKRARVCAGSHHTELWVVQSLRGRFYGAEYANTCDSAVTHLAAFSGRPRNLDEEELGFEHAQTLIRNAQSELGPIHTAELFFAAERSYWESRNAAARLQKSRQDALGFGWGNHDHHTYRSSREHFARLIETLELLGLRCRERFYAGREAGWGAQVLAHPETGLMVFADVDLEPHEVSLDFAHEGLPARDKLGTVGLWCKLHGEAFGKAGMHHLEAQFDFDEACRQLAPLVGVMPPFTSFPYLKQCFTRAELWPVSEPRLQDALRNHWISEAQATAFGTAGALGSHLEILERNDGYAGFNQTGISEIIARTDPRRGISS